MKNFVTIFSNGMAHVTRQLVVKSEQKISIPVKTNDVGDVLGTLTVRGNVLLTESPSCPAEEPSKVIALDPNNINKDLAQRFRGSAVEMQRKDGTKVAGTLTGRQDFTEVVGESVVDRYAVTVYTADGSFVSVNDTDIERLSFTQEEVKQTIKKALASNYSQINPDSTLVEFSVAPADGKEATAGYQFTVPFAVWHPVYQLWLTKDGAEIEANAKIDNPTDEDLKDTIFSVVTGAPRTFSTNLGTVVCPKRQHVAIVADHADGASGMEDGMEVMESYSSASSGPSKSARARGGSVRALAAPAAAARGFDDDAAMMDYECTSGGGMPRVAAGQAATADVGDFAVYTSKTPMNLGRKRSAVIPLFQTKVDGEALLVYKSDQPNQKRADRAVRFKNTTSYSLGKGNCTIYNENVYQGQCVIDGPVKPGEERLLPHAVENGVLVLQNPPGSGAGTRSRRSRIQIEAGVIKYDIVTETESVYRFQNNKDEPFKVAIQHSTRLPESKPKFIGNDGSPLTLENGYRIPASLPAKGHLEVRVLEVKPIRQTITLQDTQGYNWLLANVVDAEGGAAIKGFDKVKDAVVKLEEVNAKLHAAKREVEMLKGEQQRKESLVKAAGSGSRADGWLKELGSNEEELKKLERTTVPTLEKESREAGKAVNEALKAVVYTWGDEEA